jgi:hypothetical protein
VAVQLLFHQIEEALAWSEVLDFDMLELATLMTISVKEAYDHQKTWEECKIQPEKKIEPNQVC